MNAALSCFEFLEAAMGVLQAAVPGFMVSSKCVFFGACGFYSGGENVDCELIEQWYRQHGRGLYLAAGTAVKAGLCEVCRPVCTPRTKSDIVDRLNPLLDSHHVASVGFWDLRGTSEPECILSIHRSAKDGEFSRDEIGLLLALRPGMDRARRRVRRIEMERSELHSLEVLVRKLPLATVVLDWELSTVFANAAGRECCAEWTNEPGRSRLKHRPECEGTPGDLREVCCRMKSAWNTDSSHQKPLEEMVLGKAHRAVRIAMVPLGGAHPGRPSFLVQFLHSNGKGTSGDDGLVALDSLAELSLEERAVARQVGQGKSNDEISAALGKSVCTVKRHVYSIFRKLQITNRTQLAMRFRAP